MRRVIQVSGLSWLVPVPALADEKHPTSSSSSPLEDYIGITSSCVTGQTTYFFHQKTLDQCAVECNAEPTCAAFEYAPKLSEKGFRHGDCNLKASTNLVGCDGKASNLDLYIRKAATSFTWTANYTFLKRGCVNQHNIEKFKGISSSRCAEFCDANPDCISFEYASGAQPHESAYPPGSCNLQDSTNTFQCDGGSKNLDLYVRKGVEIVSSDESCVDLAQRSEYVCPLAEVETTHPATLPDCQAECIKDSSCIGILHMYPNCKKVLPFNTTTTCDFTNYKGGGVGTWHVQSRACFAGQNCIDVDSKVGGHCDPSDDGVPTSATHEECQSVCIADSACVGIQFKADGNKCGKLLESDCNFTAMHTLASGNFRIQSRACFYEKPFMIRKVTPPLFTMKTILACVAGLAVCACCVLKRLTRPRGTPMPLLTETEMLDGPRHFSQF